MNARVIRHAFNIADLREMARRRLPRGIFEFVDRGSEDEVAIRANLDALRAIKILPRQLVDVSERNLSCTLFGRRQSLPLVIGPTGIADLLWLRGELALARAAAKAGIPFVLATSSTTALETVMEATEGRMWMQMYLWQQRELSYEVLERAKRAGVPTLVLTVDTAVIPNREFNPRNGFTNPFRLTPRIFTDLLLHPRWLAGVMGRYMLAGGLPRYANYPEAMQAKVTAAPVRIANATDVTWDDVRRLRDMWPGTLVLKGILAPQDAVMAERCSVDGIIVSNHGGRNLDSATPAILALPAIRAAVSERMTVLVDGGMRRGSDILKGMALGADAVLIGKAALYALAAGGEDGVSRALGFFRDELDRTLALCGARTPEEGRTRVVKPQASFASDKGEHHGGPCTRQDVAEPFQ